MISNTTAFRGAAQAFSFIEAGLVQCVDVLLSSLTTTTTGSVSNITAVSDVSGNAKHLVCGSGQAGPVLLSENGASVLSFTTGGAAQLMAADYGASYSSYTVVLLVRAPAQSAGVNIFYHGSPTVVYEPRPFMYMNDNSYKFFGGNGYQSFDILGTFPGNWKLIVLRRNNATSATNWYQTAGQGFSPRDAGNSPFTGIAFGNGGTVQLRSHLFYNRSLSDSEMVQLIAQYQALHGFAL